MLLLVLLTPDLHNTTNNVATASLTLYYSTILHTNIDINARGRIERYTCMRAARYCYFMCDACYVKYQVPCESHAVEAMLLLREVTLPCRCASVPCSRCSDACPELSHEPVAPVALARASQPVVQEETLRSREPDVRSRAWMRCSISTRT